MSIKPAPQRWQDNQEPFDVVVVFEERLMDNLLEGEPPFMLAPRSKRHTLMP